MFRGVYQGIGSVILATLPSCKSMHLNGLELKRLDWSGIGG
jgi:hypothetical protein